MATIVTPTDRLNAAQKKQTASIYLAGPFDDKTDSSQPNWRDQVTAGLQDLDAYIIDPRSARWAEFELDSPGRRGAYDWQCSMAFDADVVTMWLPADEHAPTALMLLGYLAAKRGNAKRGSSVVVGGNGHRGLAKLFAQNQRLFPVDGDIAEVTRISRVQLTEAITSRRHLPKRPPPDS